MLVCTVLQVKLNILHSAYRYVSLAIRIEETVSVVNKISEQITIILDTLPLTVDAYKMFKGAM